MEEVTRRRSWEVVRKMLRNASTVAGHLSGRRTSISSRLHLSGCETGIRMPLHELSVNYQSRLRPLSVRFKKKIIH